jgi:hypothetical protein
MSTAYSVAFVARIFFFERNWWLGYWIVTLQILKRFQVLISGTLEIERANLFIALAFVFVILKSIMFLAKRRHPQISIS